MLPEPNDKPEMVDHPAHYRAPNDPTGQYEAIRVIEAAGHGEGFLIGSALKYILRAGKKPGSPERLDLQKAVVCLQQRIKQLERDED